MKEPNLFSQYINSEGKVEHRRIKNMLDEGKRKYEKFFDKELQSVFTMDDTVGDTIFL